MLIQRTNRNKTSLQIAVPTFTFPGGVTIRRGQQLAGKASNYGGGGLFVRFDDPGIIKDGLILNPPKNLRRGQPVDVRITALRRHGDEPFIDLELVAAGNPAQLAPRPAPRLIVRPTLVPPRPALPVTGQLTREQASYGGDWYASPGRNTEDGGSYVQLASGAKAMVPDILMEHRVLPNGPLEVMRTGIYHDFHHKEICCTAGFLPVAARLLAMIVERELFEGRTEKASGDLARGHGRSESEAIYAVRSRYPVLGEYCLRAFRIDQGRDSFVFRLQMPGIGAGSTAEDLIRKMATTSLLAVIS